ncbi:hypothetical protein AMTR_s00028p00246660 [Amborella trichopoda]|uniref:Uncharacterized protein n=1 Tax=Amborella trichopoda TaxID=13333 RepID=W1PL26_AMBTC|nr:hypothetical protein AMTR_s00028p00246660 [Amborella trichopoda]
MVDMVNERVSETRITCINLIEFPAYGVPNWEESNSKGHGPTWYVWKSLGQSVVHNHSSLEVSREEDKDSTENGQGVTTEIMNGRHSHNRGCCTMGVFDTINNYDEGG